MTLLTRLTPEWMFVKQFVKHLALLLPHEANRASSHGQLKSAEIISTSEWNLRNRMKNKAMCRSGFSI